MVYDAEGIIEKVGSAVGADDRRVKGDLERFKRLVEERGIETGSWRGKVHEGDVQSERGRGQEDAFDADDRAMPDTGGRSEAVDSAGTGADDEQAPLLAPRDAEDLRQRWQSVQMRFVDEPREMVGEADDLVDELMQRLMAGFNERRSLLSQRWEEGEQASTEELRVALTRYRSFFNRLLST
jgi:hypothetical protein